MRRVLPGLLLTALVLYMAVGAVLYVGQRRILFIPDTARPDAAAAGIPGLRALELTTADGLRLLAWAIPARAGQPTLLYFHGNGGNLADRVDRLRRFAGLGWGVLMPEYRGYGGNPGSPSERGFARDAEAAYAALAAERITPVVYGESIGTGVATRIAAGHAVLGLILESPYTSITAIAARRYWFLPVGLLVRDRFDILSRIRDVHAPLLVVQGAEDTIVPPDMGRTVFAAAHEPKTLWTAPHAGHMNLVAAGAMGPIEAFVAGLPP